MSKRAVTEEPAAGTRQEISVAWDLGGGAGLWLASHFSVLIAGLALCTISVISAFSILMFRDIQRDKEKRFANSLSELGKGIMSMIKIPVVLFVMLMLCMPIGTGAANNLWSAIAADWKTSADTVALVTGILSGLVSALGCVAGGIVADRWGNWVAYLGAGLFCAGVTLIMAVFPLEPWVYISGVLVYSFGLGLMNAAFTSVILYAIGEKNASTKYALLSSLGNLPVVYMTTFDGWAHDKYNSKYMLVAEALACILFVAICIFTISQLKKRKLLLLTID